MIRFEYELEQFVAKSCNDIVNSMTKPAFSHRLQAGDTTMLGLYIFLLLSRCVPVDAYDQCMRHIFLDFMDNTYVHIIYKNSCITYLN